MGRSATNSTDTCDRLARSKLNAAECRVIEGATLGSASKPYDVIVGDVTGCDVTPGWIGNTILLFLLLLFELFDRDKWSLSFDMCHRCATGQTIGCVTDDTYI